MCDNVCSVDVKEKKKYLIVIDMQNDFITGSLQNKEAEKIVPSIAKIVRHFDGEVILTQDSHNFNYLKTQEGKNLPVEHCIRGTNGWLIHKDIMDAIKYREDIKPYSTRIIEKEQFGYRYWNSSIHDASEIIICGVVTDICVVTNALMIKADHPEVPVKVLKDYCAGLNPEKHEAAISVMESCQIKIETGEYYV